MSEQEPDRQQVDDLERLRRRLEPLTVEQVVTELGRLDRRDRAIAFRLLPKGRALGVFEDLDPALQRELLDDLRAEATHDLVAELDPDDRARLFDELPAVVATRLLAGLDPEERALTDVLLGYPPESVGRRMSPEVAALPEDLTAGEAIERLRDYGEAVETIYSVPVLGPGRTVIGIVSLRRLLLSDPAARLTDLMSDPTTVEATWDQERAAMVVREGGFIGVPVVDHEGRLLGIFTVDDAMRILEAEEDEDSSRFGGTEPLRRPYLTVSVLGLVRARVVWLLFLIVAASLTVGVQSYFEAELDEVVALALFIPLLIGTGGNAGSQAATTVVRAMALEDIRPADVLRVVGREVLTGACLGLSLAALGFVPAMLVAGLPIAQVLAVTVVGICTLATTVGSAVPMVVRRLGIDPAIVSAPFITTFVDTLGLIMYFSVAKLILAI